MKQVLLLLLNDNFSLTLIKSHLYFGILSRKATSVVVPNGEDKPQHSGGR